jgi:hypothetical protein
MRKFFKAVVEIIIEARMRQAKIDIRYKHY